MRELINEREFVDNDLCGTLTPTKFATYYAVVDKSGKHIQVDVDTGQLEMYETESHAKASVRQNHKIITVYVSADITTSK